VIPLKFKTFVTSKLHDEFRRMIEIFSGDHVTTICNSRTTSMDLQSARAEMGLVSDRPVVVPPGCDIQPVAEKDEATRLDVIPGPYILYVSTVEIRKNHKLLLEAYDLMRRDESFDPPHLVLVGQRGWLVDDLLRDIDERRGAASRVILLTAVSDAHLSQLYKDAIFTVYPSFYEGWGIPVAESLYHRKFCLCSDRGALPEAGGSFVEYLDPEDSASWALRIRHYVDHPEDLLDRERRIESGHAARRWSNFRQEAKDVFASAFIRRG
jgi:glycosyltransferase involved in cell wall biosynthesis